MTDDLAKMVPFDRDVELLKEALDLARRARVDLETAEQSAILEEDVAAARAMVGDELVRASSCVRQVLEGLTSEQYPEGRYYAAKHLVPDDPALLGEPNEMALDGRETPATPVGEQLLQMVLSGMVETTAIRGLVAQLSPGQLVLLQSSVGALYAVLVTS